MSKLTTHFMKQNGRLPANIHAATRSNTRTCRSVKAIYFHDTGSQNMQISELGRRKIQEHLKLYLNVQLYSPGVVFKDIHRIKAMTPT